MIFIISYQVLVSSGIDHDIKIWSPMAEESQWNEEEAQKIMNINELMSSEAKDTVIITSSVLFRIVISLVMRENRGISSNKSYFH